ncbi:MAG TPA: SIMPL domain-containing protein [Caulobacteraceae bacterium]|jgi:hypothetical protein|nr:SIMPL domain-containing protein [Caulobacteraceae bacterium]
MRVAVLSLLAFIAVPVSALAQTPPASIGAPNVPAPWWMSQPVIPSIGYVRVELPANRAGFNTSFEVVDRNAAEATTKAAEKVRALARALQQAGAEKVHIQTTFTSRPLYEQYRDKDGNLVNNVRADKIDRYEVQAIISIEVRDMALLEPTYAIVIAAKPTSTSPVNFWLDPTDEAKSRLYVEAVKDAARRADLSVEAAGAKRGAVKLIDQTGRACQTDVLAGWPSYGPSQIAPTPLPASRIYGSDAVAGVITERNFNSSGVGLSIVGGAGASDGNSNVGYYFNSPQGGFDARFSAVDLAGLGDKRTVVLADGKRLMPGAPGDQQAGAIDDTPLPLEPPMEVITAQACVVYALA